MVGPLLNLVGSGGRHRLRQAVFRQAQVRGDAVLGAHPGGLSVAVLVTVEIDPPILFGCPAAVGVVAADVARAGIEAEPAPVAQARGLESGGRRGDVGFLEGEGVS